MSRKRRDREDDRKPLQARAKDLADWLADIEGSAGFIRFCRLWWNRYTILGLALEAMDALAAKDKVDEKLRRTIALLVTQFGGPSINWEKQATKGAD